jgi:transcriptional regulator with XRE-family HTH domain
MVRMEKGMRQSELALITGLKQPNLSRIENGLVVPRPATLEKIAKALGVDAEVFYSESKIHEVERKWALAMGPKHTALVFAEKTISVPLLDTARGYPSQLDARGEPQGPLEMVLQLPPMGSVHSDARCFALRVFADAAHAAALSGFHRGDIVIFGSKPEVGNGDAAFVMTSRGGVFCRVQFADAETLRLVTDDQCHAPHVVRVSDVLRMWRLIAHVRFF